MCFRTTQTISFYIELLYDMRCLTMTKGFCCFIFFSVLLLLHFFLLLLTNGMEWSLCFYAWQVLYTEMFTTNMC